MDDDLIAVESILLQAHDAPKYGVNSRELVLRAARAAVHGPAAAHTCAPSSTGQPCRSAAPPNRQPDQQLCDGEAAEELVQSLTVHERPLVQYIARSAVPRIARQGVANRLAGQHMAYLLQRAGLPISAVGLQLPEAVAIRKAGVAAGLAQELNLYRKSNSKLAFMNAAARTRACPSFLPPASEAADPPQTAMPPLEEGTASGGHADKRHWVDKAQPGTQQREAQEENANRSNSRVELQEAQEEDDANNSSRVEAASANRVSPGAVLLEDAIPWDAEDPSGTGAASDSGMSLTSSDTEDASKASNTRSRSLEDTAAATLPGAPDEDQREKVASRVKRRKEDGAAALMSIEAPGLAATELVRAGGIGDMLAGGRFLSAKPPRQLQADSRAQEEYSPSNSLDVQEFAFSSALEQDGPNVSSMPDRPLGSAAGQEADGSGVRRATTRFVRAILDPLYQAKVITRDVHRKVLERAVEKIVKLHADAPSASFLVDEAGKVQRLVSDYVQHLQGRSMTLY